MICCYGDIFADLKEKRGLTEEEETAKCTSQGRIHEAPKGEIKARLPFRIQLFSLSHSLSL